MTTDWQYYMYITWNAPFVADTFGKEGNNILIYGERLHGAKRVENHRFRAFYHFAIPETKKKIHINFFFSDGFASRFLGVILVPDIPLNT